MIKHLSLKILKEILYAFFVLKPQIIFLDCPLLFEYGLHHLCSETLVIGCEENLQIERVVKRDSLSKEIAQKRILVQKSLDAKISAATHSIDNSSSKDKMFFEMKKWLIGLLKRRAKNHWVPTVTSLFVSSVLVMGGELVYKVIKFI